MDELNEKVIIITGGSSGIGLVIIKKLLDTNIKFIAMFELDSPNSRKVFQDLEKVHKTKIGFYPCDVTNTSQLEEHFESVFQTYKTVDILINNAGTITEEVPGLVIDINYKAVVLGSLMMVNRVGKHHGSKGGTIVNIASVLGLYNIILPVYCSSKHAVVSFTQTMKQHFDVIGVKVVAVCPGMTETPIIQTGLQKMLDFVTMDPVEMASTYKPQSPENVAMAVIKIINEGRCEDIWVSENDEPPYEVVDLELVKSNL